MKDHWLTRPIGKKKASTFLTKNIRLLFCLNLNDESLVSEIEEEKARTFFHETKIIEHIWLRKYVPTEEQLTEEQFQEFFNSTSSSESKLQALFS